MSFESIEETMTEGLFTCFWLHWVFVAAHRLSLVAPHRLVVVVVSHCGAQAKGAWASVVAVCGLSSCGPQA